MTDRGFAIDPAPERELPSDIAFRMWLAGLTLDVVIADLEASTNWHESKILAGVRRQRLHDRRYP